MGEAFAHSTYLPCVQVYIEFELFEILYINLNIFQANSRLSSSILVSSAMVGYLADGSRIAILLCLRAPQHSRP